MSLKENDIALEKMREDWLEEMGLTEDDIFYHEDSGEEYYIEEFENGNPGEDGYDAGTRKRQVPRFKVEDLPEVDPNLPI